MNLEYFAHLREYTRCNQEVYSKPVDTLGALLTDLCQKYGPGFKKWLINDDGSLCEIAIILVNGKDVRHSGKLDTVLHGEDKISIFPPVAGG